jgi:hypothetical protein
MMLVICLPLTLLFWAQSPTVVDTKDLRLVYSEQDLEGERGDALTSSIREFGRYGKTEPKKPVKLLSDADEKIIEREILPAGRKYWQDSKSLPDYPGGVSSYCAHDFSVIGLAEGSFTKPRAKERAILYQYCATGHNFALNGVAVLDGGAVVGHIVYRGGWNSAIFALPPFDGSARSEMLIVTGGINCGELWGVISIVRLSEKGVIKIGHAHTYTDDCGAGLDGATAYKWYVKPGAVPVFYREAFTRAGCANAGEHSPGTGQAKWAKSEPLTQADLERDEVEYVRLK